MALFERFTERARQVVVHSQEEARTLKHDHIGTEHLLLGLLREQDGLAAGVLETLGITLEQARGEVVRVVGVGEEESPRQMPFTPDAKRVLELALRESLPLGHDYIGTEHVLLALVSLDEGPSVQILDDLGVKAEAVRTETLRRLGPPEPIRAQAVGRAHAGPRSVDELFRLRPASGTRRLLMLAGARALEDERSQIEPRDVLLAMVRDEQLGPLLAGLGADEAAVVKALSRRAPSESPPEASADG